MSHKLKNIVATIADNLFLPVDTEYRDYFTKPLRIIILLFFVYSLIIAFPPIINAVKASAFFLPFISNVVNDPTFWGKWLPYINFVLEVLFFLMIGGSVFSEWIAAHSEETIKKYELAVEKAKELEVLDKKDELAIAIDEYYALLEGVELRNFLPKIYSLYKGSRKIIRMLLNDVAKVNARFLGTKLAVSFPGGAYGLFAFVLFAMLIQVKIGQFYLP